jgi:hypothetical protein
MKRKGSLERASLILECGSLLPVLRAKPQGGKSAHKGALYNDRGSCLPHCKAGSRTKCGMTIQEMV